MNNQWEQQLRVLSGNLTTNALMPEFLIKKLLEENESLRENLNLEEITPPKLENSLLNEIEGLNILSDLQKLSKKECLTLFRAVRFPTWKRINEAVGNGYIISNYEQERISSIYKNENYIEKRNKIKSDTFFWTQPQERVVHGLPLFSLVNDALQIHRAFRAEKDKVMIIALYLPHELFETRKVKLIANTAIDLDYENYDRDFEVKDFYKKDGVYEIDYESLRTRGIDLHEMYTKDLPLDIEEATKMGITYDVFLLDIYEINEQDEKIKELFNKTTILKENKYFLHGFFGDQNIFGRRSAKYLPNKCNKVTKK